MMTMTKQSPSAATQELVGTRGRLVNPSPYRRREWCPIGVPYATAKSLPEECTFVTDRGLNLRAVRCDDVGTHTTMYRVFAPFDAQQAVDGVLTVLGNEPEARRLSIHPWARELPVERLIPKVAVRIGGVDYWCETPDLLEIESGDTDASPNGCYQRWHLRGRCGSSGFVVEGWVTFYDMSVVADVELAVIWSDRSNPASDLWVDGILLATGYPVRFDFALRNGMLSLPVFDGSDWINAIAGTQTVGGRQVLGFVDGSGVPFVGRMVFPPPTDVDVETADYQEDAATVAAAASDPVYGIADRNAWHGRWLAHGNVAELLDAPWALSTLAASADGLYSSFGAMLSLSAGVYAPRPIGTTQNPGGTGDQEDFNATKGGLALNAADPRWIHYAMYSVLADYFRGFMHYEGVPAKPLDPQQHLRWITWSGYTHYNTNVSPDRIGKSPVAWGARFATGWNGYDDQHRSQLNLQAVYALTGKPILRHIIEQISTSDYANTSFRGRKNTDAPRAVGRLALTWSGFLRLLDFNSETYLRYRELLDDKLSIFLVLWWGDKFSGSIDILYALTDPRTGITWAGQPAPAWVVWEHGLLVTGAYAAWKVTGDDRWLDIVRRVSRTIVKWGAFSDEMGWWLCNHVHWPTPGAPGPYQTPIEGEPIGIGYYSRSSTLVTWDRGGVATWTFPAVLAFVETLASDGTVDPDLSRALSIINQFVGDATRTDVRTAEWWAVVRTVDPPLLIGGYVGYDVDALRPDLAAA